MRLRSGQIGQLRRILAVVSALALSPALASCGGAATDGGSGKVSAITIAYQPGLGYAPLLLAKQQGLLEKKLPGAKITWKVLSSGAAIRDGMLAGEIQVGAGGIGPFLVGYDGGVQWKIVSALNDMNLHLMVKDPKYKGLADLKGAGKVAMPAPDSIQAVVLRKAAQDHLGDAKALDSQIIAMSHPDGLQALMSGQIAAHLTSPPFQSQEQAQGAHKVVGSYDVFGEHTFNSAFMLTAYSDKHPDVRKALEDSISEAVQMLTSQPDQAAALLSAESGGKTSVNEEKAQITASDVKFTTKPLGFIAFAKFMQQIGLIKKVPGSASDLFFANDLTEGGS